MTSSTLSRPVEAEYTRFLQIFRSRTFDQTPILDEVGKVLDRHPGKQLRPLLVLLAAKACGMLCEKHVLFAAAVELLHNASLMHDDVVDESDSRRGVSSVRGNWGNPAAVLTGDYYLAQAMLMLQQAGDSRASELVAGTVADMCRGELLQLTVTKTKTESLGDYMKIIEDKTASLISACCQLGALGSDGVASPYFDTLRTFGLHYGILFQLHDDLASLDPRHDASLPQGIDVEELIADHTCLANSALNTLPPSDARDCLRSLLLPSAPKPS